MCDTISGLELLSWHKFYTWTLAATVHCCQCGGQSATLNISTFNWGALNHAYGAPMHHVPTTRHTGQNSKTHVQSLATCVHVHDTQFSGFGLGDIAYSTRHAVVLW